MFFLLLFLCYTFFPSFLSQESHKFFGVAHKIFCVLAAIFYVLSFVNSYQVTSWSPFDFECCSWHDDEQKGMQRCMLPGEGSLQHAPQHLTESQRIFSVTTKSWNSSLLLLLTIVKWSFLLPHAASIGIGYVTLEYSGECAEEPEYFHAPQCLV